jgi:hypothetical protein
LNSVTLEVFHFGSFQNLQGLLENQTGGMFTNSGSVANLSGGIIHNNAGSIINDRSLVNAGTVNNACGATFTGSVNGNQPVNTCLKE